MPSVYEKHVLPVSTQSKEGKEDGEVEALVYVDVQRVSDGICRKEYMARMNRGIKDAVEKGMPAGYVRDVLRRWVPEEDLDDGDVKDPFFKDIITAK